MLHFGYTNFTVSRAMIYQLTVTLIFKILVFTMVTGDSRHVSYTQEETGSLSDSLDKWWTYDGLSGPNYWSQPIEWKMCGFGKQQSPINISPKVLLFDPNLSSLAVNITNVNGLLFNTGNDVTFFLSNDEFSHINITGGPLTYVYTITDLKFHFGKGRYTQSEHSINDRHFPAEIQIRGYNRDVYGSYKDAVTSVRGIVIVAVFVEIGQDSNSAFEIINEKLPLIKTRDNKTSIRNFPVHLLLPNTEEYMTYEGSLTQPGCQESVTWILLNTPIFVSEEQLKAFQNEAAMEWRKNNARPLQPLNHRVIRTNIRHRSKTSSSKCQIEKKFNYQVNDMYES